jgi:hypothetical protein
VRAVIALGRPESSNSLDCLKGTVQRLLHREVIRQAVLIAARDGLGLGTRDEVRGDRLPEAAGGGAAEIVWNFRMDPGASRVFILRGHGDPKAEILLRHDLLPSSAAELDYLPRLTTLAESLSRTELPAALEALGLKGEPNRYRAEAALPEKVEDRLDQLGFVENVTAVRDLHEAIRTDGESPARLGALARGYALLGVLSEFHWHPAHNAFKARALLYAERLVAREANSPRSLRHRAFVQALVGLPKFARANLEEARKRVPADKTAVPPPAWESLIDAYLASDLERLKIKDSRPARLAALLRLMSVEFPSRMSLALGASRDVIATDCFRAHDAMCRVGGVANLHTATTAGRQALGQLLPTKLGALATAPAGVREALDRRGSLLALVKALERAGAPADDRGEPSWGVLAHLVHETLFVQIYRRLHFLKGPLAVTVDDFWAAARPPIPAVPGEPGPAAQRGRPCSHRVRQSTRPLRHRVLGVPPDPGAGTRGAPGRNRSLAVRLDAQRRDRP